MDGHLKDEDVNLASSTMISDGKTANDAMGIVISYSMRVKVNCGTLGGELVTDVPFKLMHPAPGEHNAHTLQESFMRNKANTFTRFKLLNRLSSIESI